MSAEANLAGLNNWILSFFFYEVILNLQCVGFFCVGLYPPEGQQIFQPSLKWQPIPVHTVPENEEKVGVLGLCDAPAETADS